MAVDLTFAQAKRLAAQQRLWAAQYYARQAMASNSTHLARLYRERAETKRLEAYALIQQAQGWDKEATNA